MTMWLQLAVLVGVLGIIWYAILLRRSETHEDFMAGPCPNCGKRTQWQCSECGSCGWCVTPDGYGECVPGDQRGPYFRQDCLSWQYHPRTTPTSWSWESWRPRMSFGFPHHRSWPWTWWRR